MKFRLAPALASLITLVMLVWMGHSLAAIFWAVMPRNSTVLSELFVDFSVSSQDSSASIDMTAIQRALVLSSVAGANLSSTTDSLRSAVDTRLELSLRGAVPAADPERSRAIIASGEEQRVYRVGEQLAGAVDGVSLAAVYTDFVILDNNGREERLRMFDDVVTAVAGLRTGDQQLVEISQLPTESTVVSAALSKVLRLQFYQDDEVTGLQIRHGSRSDLLSEVGLRVGDLITEINSVAVSDITQIPLLLSRLESGQNLSLRVRRDDTFLSVSLNRAALRLP